MKESDLYLPLKRFLESQDGIQNGARMAQEESKSLLNSNFFALAHRLKFCLVLGAVLGRFCHSNWDCIAEGATALGGLEVDFVLDMLSL